MKNLLMIEPAFPIENPLYSSRYLNKAALVVINWLKAGSFKETENKDYEEELDRLNKLASQAPFCVVHKVRKFDVL